MDHPPEAAPAAPPDGVDVRQVARSFYAMLESEGFTSDQVLQLANDLLSLVREDLGASPRPSDRR
jgi:hypothetical protein